MKRWERLPHTADSKIRVYGSTLQELFEQALKAMFEVLGPVYEAGKKERVVHEVHVLSPNVEVLLVDFLSEAWYLSAVHDEAYDLCEITFFSSHEVRATVQGFPVERYEHGEIKAVTYHELVVKESDGIWHADIVFDI